MAETKNTAGRKKSYAGSGPNDYRAARVHKKVKAAIATKAIDYSVNMDVLIDLAVSLLPSKEVYDKLVNQANVQGLQPNEYVEELINLSD